MQLGCTRYHTLEDPYAGENWEEVDCSNNLGRMMVYLRDTERVFFSNGDLNHLGINAVSLPGVESLLTGDHFQPCSTFGSDTDIARNALDNYGFDGRDDRPQDREMELCGYLVAPNLIYTLFTMAGEMVRKKLAEGAIVSLTDYDPDFYPWIKEGALGQLYGIVEGIWAVDILDHYGCPGYAGRVGAWKWLIPQYRDLPTHIESEVITTQPPHSWIGFETFCPSNEGVLFKREIIIILQVIYNRVHQRGFENETKFPVFLCSAYRDRMARIIEAVYDKSNDNLTLRVSPLYSFLEAETSPWDVFMRIVSSSPRVNVTDKILSARLRDMQISEACTEDGSRHKI